MIRVLLTLFTIRQQMQVPVELVREASVLFCLCKPLENELLSFLDVGRNRCDGFRIRTILLSVFRAAQSDVSHGANAGP